MCRQLSGPARAQENCEKDLRSFTVERRAIETERGVTLSPWFKEKVVEVSIKLTLVITERYST